MNEKGNDGQTPLHDGCFNGHVKVCILLVRQGADVNARTIEGTTSLIGAAFLGLEVLVKIFVEARADVTVMTSSFKFGIGTALDAAKVGGHSNILQLLACHMPVYEHKTPDRSCEVEDRDKVDEQIDGAGEDKRESNNDSVGGSDDSEKRPFVGDICTGRTIKYGYLQAVISRFAKDGNFRVNYETDRSTKYKGRTRIVCKCSAGGHAKSKRKNDLASDDFDMLPNVFSKSRRRVSIKTGCPWRIVVWCNEKMLLDDT